METSIKKAVGQRGASFVALLLAPYLTLAVVALTWPADQDWRGLEFSRARWIDAVPSMAAYVRRSQFPSATAAYLTLSAAQFLPAFLALLRAPDAMFGASPAMRRYVEQARRWPLLMPIGTIALCALALVVCWIQDGYQFGLLPLNEQRWALALGGPLFAFPTLLYYLVASAAFAVRLLCGAIKESRHGVE